MQELGARAFEVLYSRISGADTKQDVVLPVQLVVRESCGCPPSTTASSSTVLLARDGR
jgi:DNA-binding LacI/PurR family transcriptional regulator